MKQDYASLEQKCLSHMAENGIAFSGPLDTDGNIHRFSGGSNKGKKDEWYIAFRGTSNSGYEYLNCSYGSWKASTTVDGKHTFTSYDNDCTLDSSERQQLQEEIKKKKEESENQIKELREAAAKEAQRIWNECEDVQALESHLEYCTVKGISPVGVRFGSNPQGYSSMVIPIKNSKEEIRSLQFISVGRESRVYKTFLSGGEKSGNFFAIGELTDAASICVCEGYATGVSVNLAFKDLTEHPVVVVAFDCHNLDPVVAAIRNKCPKSSIVICADDDVETPGNPGRTRAQKVAAKYEAICVFPQFFDGKRHNTRGCFYTDFNDLAAVMGVEEVTRQLKDVFIPAWVRKFNKNHAVVHTSQTYILTEKYDPQLKRESFSLEPVQSFHTWYKPEKDPVTKRSLSKLWLENRYRREYRGILFDPKIIGDYGGFYNLFQGFPISPKKGKCDLFWKLIKEGWCAGDDVKYAYVRKWLAHLIQRPWELPETAIALRGQQGTGKGSGVQYIARLMGNHYLELVQMDQVVGRFNGHLKDVILVYANEAIWGGNKCAEGALKAIVTDSHQAIEYKGKDIITVQNFKRLILSSNEDYIVARDIDDRRFFVLDCSATLKEDPQFFKELHAQMANSGVQALMFDLVHEDISDWHPRQMPIIADGFDLKVRGMNSTQQWLYNALRDSKIVIDDNNNSWPLNDFFDVSKHRVYSGYKLYCEDQKEKAEYDGLFWKRVREILGDMQEQKPHGSSRTIKFPPLSIARRMFQKYAKAEGSSLWDY